MHTSFDQLVSQFNAHRTEYTLAVTRDGEHWYTVTHKWYQSAALAIAAYKKTPYAYLNQFKEIRILERVSSNVIFVSVYK